MTLALAVLAVLASFASLASLATSPPRFGRLFVTFALWTVFGALDERPALVAASAVCLILTALILSARALLGAPIPTRTRARA